MVFFYNLANRVKIDKIIEKREKRDRLRKESERIKKQSQEISTKMNEEKINERKISEKSIRDNKINQERSAKMFEDRIYKQNEDKIKYK